MVEVGQRDGGGGVIFSEKFLALGHLRCLGEVIEQTTLVLKAALQYRGFSRGRRKCKSGSRRGYPIAAREELVGVICDSVDILSWTLLRALVSPSFEGTGCIVNIMLLIQSLRGQAH